MRHGATEWNRTKRAQGHADIDLNAEGRKQALRAARELARLDIEAVYSSDLRRAADTATPIATSHGVETTQLVELREIDQGEWTGLTVDEIRRRWPERWGPARHYSQRPGGESPRQVRERALRALKKVVESHPEGTVVVVSHGVTIRCLMAEALGYDERRSASLRGLSNGGIVTLEARLQGGELVLGRLQRLDGRGPDLDDPNQ